MKTETYRLEYKGKEVSLHLFDTDTNPNAGVEQRTYIIRDVEEMTPVDAFKVVRWTYKEGWSPWTLDTCSELKRKLRYEAADLLNREEELNAN